MILNLLAAEGRPLSEQLKVLPSCIGITGHWMLVVTTRL